jgi:glycosyltransferase involved in cell wall biosynthesis
MKFVHQTQTRRRKHKVCIIAGQCLKGDATSAAMVADCEALLASSEFDPFLLSGRCEIDIPHANVPRLKNLLYHPRFLDADIRIFHFGYYSELFNASMLGNGRVKRVLRFHNVTPAEFVAPSERKGIEKSLRQIAVMAKADEVWPISNFNAQTLAEMGCPVDFGKVLPMPVTPLTGRLDPRHKTGPITITYVGRIVPAKGIHLLLDAFELLTAKGYADVELDVIGGIGIRSYTADIKARLKNATLRNARYLGRLSHANLARAYARAGIVVIPSFHEGLCVPVIEALCAGAIPVVSNTAALPDTLNGLGRLTPVGDATALAECLEEVIADLRAIRRNEEGARIRVERGSLLPDDYHAAVSRYVETFTPKELGAELVRRLRGLVLSSFPRAAELTL